MTVKYWYCIVLLSNEKYNKREKDNNYLKTDIIYSFCIDNIVNDTLYYNVKTIGPTNVKTSKK